MITANCSCFDNYICKKCKNVVKWVRNQKEYMRGQCWVMDCENKPVHSFRTSPDYCFEHSDRGFL